MPAPIEPMRVFVVDNENRPLAVMAPGDAHNQGLRHRGFMLLAWDKRGRLVLRRREQTAPLHPGRLDVLGSGHIAHDLAAEEAAGNALPAVARDPELILEHLSSLHRGAGSGREFVEIFGACLPEYAVRALEQDYEFLFVDQDECLALIRSYPDRLTPDLHSIWKLRLWPDKIKT